MATFYGGVFKLYKLNPPEGDKGILDDAACVVLRTCVKRLWRLWRRSRSTRELWRSLGSNQVSLLPLWPGYGV